MYVTYEEAVRDAALVLDVIRPGWHEKIVTDQLAMMKPDRCIAGHMGEYWGRLADEVAERLPEYENIHPRALFADEQTCTLWIEEILARRAVAPGHRRIA